MSDFDYNDDVERLASTFSDILQLNRSLLIRDLSPDVLDIIKSNNRTACAEGLATSVLEYAKTNPRSIDSLVLLTHGVISQATIPVEDFWDSPSDFASVFKFHLIEFVKDALYETQLHVPKQTQISSNNSTLATAVFSASALNHGLLANVKSPYMFARQGLQLPDSVFERKREETVAIGACLQLAVAGARMMDQWLRNSDGKEVITTSLKKLKEKGAINYPAGVELLNWTIENAENDFKQQKSAEETWNMLFSS